MTAKRAATTELNHDNWNEENEPEAAGTFAKATEDILEKRVIRKAKRRLPAKDENAKSAFGSFMGFKNSTSSACSPFSFLAESNTTNTSSAVPTMEALDTNKQVTTNGASKNPENGTEKSEETVKRQASSGTSVPKQDSPPGAKDDEKIFKKSSDYFAKLKGLNESVAQWIKTHVDVNPFCILTPIFRDYERYLKEIESKHGGECSNTPKVTTGIEDAGQETKNVSGIPSLFGGTGIKSLGTGEQKIEKSIFSGISSNTKLTWGKTDQPTETPKSVFGGVEHKSDTSKSIFGSIDSKSDGKSIFGNINPEKNPFLNKPSVTPDNKSTDDGDAKISTKTIATTSPFSSANLGTATFSFGQSSATSNASAGFSFGSSKPFSFGAQVVQPPTESEDKGDGEGKEDDDDEPPKAEFKPVTEEGSVHEQRCKVFVKKDGSYVERGIGRLFLKPTPNEKTQLIVRADTSLGNLLINTLLTSSIPTKRLNKNTIMLVCLPLPDSEPPPVSVLLRVKTSEDADVLLEALNKHKK